MGRSLHLRLPVLWFAALSDREVNELTAHRVHEYSPLGQTLGQVRQTNAPGRNGGFCRREPFCCIDGQPRA